MSCKNTLSPMPTCTLANGIKVANFGSPHPFQFDDGNCLMAAQRDRTEATKCDLQEEEIFTPFTDRFKTVVMAFNVSESLELAVEEAVRQIYQDGLDVVIIPLMTASAIADGLERGKWSHSQSIMISRCFRVIRRADDRTDKPVSCSSKFSTTTRLVEVLSARGASYATNLDHP
jgi:hypothetical protein